MAEIYRETSRTHTPDGNEIYADSDVIVHGKGTTFVVKSLTTATCKRVTVDASNVDRFYEMILDAKKIIKSHDEREYRRMEVIRKGLQKPRKVGAEPPRQEPTCPYCGGSGFVTDEYDYPIVCECRR